MKKPKMIFSEINFQYRHKFGSKPRGDSQQAANFENRLISSSNKLKIGN